MAGSTTAFDLFVLSPCLSCTCCGDELVPILGAGVEIKVCALSSSGGADAVRIGTAALSGSPRRAAAANDSGGLGAAGAFDDSCAWSLVFSVFAGAVFKREAEELDLDGAADEMLAVDASEELGTLF